MKTEWCYSISGGEHFKGPFHSRDTAIAEAGDGMKQGDSFILGKCAYVQPIEWIQADAEKIVADMDEFICGDVAFDDEVFGLKDSQKAQAELKEILQTWAKKHVTTNEKFIAVETEDFEITT